MVSVILAYHLILTTYGFWLPNDPRGSWSDFVGAWELVRFGKATKTTERRSLAGDRHDRQARLRAKAALLQKPVLFVPEQVRAVATGFSIAIDEGAYAVHACSILPDHVHLVIGRHGRDIGRIAGHFKARATQQLLANGLHPFAEWVNSRGEVHSPWAAKHWKVFIDSPGWVGAAIRYVENNPVKENRPRQAWPFVCPFVGDDLARGAARRASPAAK